MFSNTDREILKMLEQGPLPQSAIVNALLPVVSQDYIYSRVKTLAARGLVEKDGQNYTKDRIVTLTKSGKAALREA